MSIADHFDQVQDAGFGRIETPMQARRQFQVSLGLVLVVIVAVASVSFAMSHDWGMASAISGHADASFAGVLDMASAK